MQIDDQIEMLEISANPAGTATIIYPTLIHDDKNAILVDTGYPNQLASIRAAIEKAGVPFDRLNLIILTHHDIDHIGSLKQFKTALKNQAKVMAFEEEIPYIQGDKRPLKLAQFEDNLVNLPAERKAFYEILKTGFSNAVTSVDKALMDGEVLPFCSGITIIATPGHTLGHICLYHAPSKTLIAGDALRVEDGQLQKTPARINHDTNLYQASLEKLTHYDIVNVISYHGGLYQSQANQKIKELALER